MTRAITLRDGRELQAGADPLEVFGDFLRLKVADGDASRETLRSYRSQVGLYMAWCQAQGIEPARATEHDLSDYRRALVDHGYKRSTIATKLSAVRRFYQAATWRKLRDDNPAEGLKAPRDRTTRAQRIHYLPLAGLVHLLGLPQNARDRAILYLMGAHGLRVSEVAGLQLEDLDLDAGTLRALGKGRKERTIFLTERTIDILRLALAERGAGPAEPALFVTTDHARDYRDHKHPDRGQAMGARAMRHLVDGYLKAAGLKDGGISCHSLRHSFATWALAAGGELLAISSKLGHSSVTTTQVYSRLVDEMQRNPTTKLEGLLYAGSSPDPRDR